jgi:hypothetical protein
MKRQLLIYEADLALLISGESVTLHEDVTVSLSAVLTVERIAALVVNELMEGDKRRARAAAVLPETKARLT